eukprot:TRINITY_DN526_c0_g1_i2.p1 TRINITY_DN526_c0_g1~~TRINITY_DN526_c0_g1_i2.p1  ORF type:complete len:519 (-),score=115.33 TRINITY_DN526_c0_g1_i2:52-1608(-)
MSSPPDQALEKNPEINAETKPNVEEAPNPPAPDPLRVGLGSFSVLSDYLVVFLLKQLPSGTLINLSEVSIAFRYFALYDKLWRRLLLLETEGAFVYNREGWYRTYRDWAFAQKLEEVHQIGGNVTAQPPKPTALIRTFHSDLLYSYWYRSQAELQNYAFDTHQVDRISSIIFSPTLFQQHYEIPNNPVIFTDILRSWKALNGGKKQNRFWTPDLLEKRFPNVLFKISAFTPPPNRRRIRMTLTDFNHYMKNQRDPDPLYIFDSGFGERAPELLRDYEVPRHFWEDFFSVLGNGRPLYRWFLMGPERSGTGFHVDPYSTSAWNALLYGRKRWALYPPDAVPPGGKRVSFSEAGVENYDAMNILEWYFKVYPYLPPNLKPIEFVQEAGDMVFIPSGWWHAVLNLTDTVSVTQNFCNSQNLHKVIENLYDPSENSKLNVLQERIKEIRADIYDKIDTQRQILEGNYAKYKFERHQKKKQEWKDEKQRMEEKIKKLEAQLQQLATVSATEGGKEENGGIKSI